MQCLKIGKVRKNFVQMNCKNNTKNFKRVEMKQTIQKSITSNLFFLFNKSIRRKEINE